MKEKPITHHQLQLNHKDCMVHPPMDLATITKDIFIKFWPDLS